MNFLSRAKRAAVRCLLNTAPFSWWEKKGFHVLPVHYYSPIPDTRLLSDELFSRVAPLTGIDLRPHDQVALIQQLSSLYRREWDAWPAEPTAKPHDFYTSQTSFRCVDAHVLYGIVRHFKPRRVIEVGSGFTTMLTAAAVNVNRAEDPDYKCVFTAIEPFPNDTLRQGFPGLDELLPLPIQEVPISRFLELEENDILFIDSTHTVKIGGDVVHEYLHILPHLRPGVLVHAHDIFLPFEYPRAWIDNKQWFWAEQYLLQAFLTFNESFRILWMSHLMHRTKADILKGLMAWYDQDTPYVSSFWMQRRS